MGIPSNLNSYEKVYHEATKNEHHNHNEKKNVQNPKRSEKRLFSRKRAT